MKLFLIILVITTIEVILIAKVGSAIGFFPTFLLILFSAFIGSALLRKQWRFVMGKLQTLQSEPSQAFLEALVLVICGILLITPGFLTDIFGFLGLIPAVRERFVAMLRRHGGGIMRNNFKVRTGGFGTGSQQSTRHDDHVIDGEFERKDD